MINIRNILFLLFITICLTNSNADMCMNQNSCLCQLNETDKIDISELTKDIIPPYYLNDTFNNSTYTFLGCENRTFNHDGEVDLGSLVITTVDTNNTATNVFSASDIRFSKEENDYLITYVGDNHIHPVIILLCRNYKNPFLKVITFSVTDPVLLLSSPKLCIQTEHHNHNNSMSGGSTFLLILFIAALIYFIGGALLLYFIRGARGVEMIPNVEFWTSLPGLVKDGLIFLLSGCKPSFVTTAETYDRI